MHVFAWYRHKNPLVWYFKITKRPNRPKKSISVPENLSIYTLEYEKRGFCAYIPLFGAGIEARPPQIVISYHCRMVYLSI